MVVVDSNVWIDYLKRPDSPTGDALMLLIRQERASVAGPVLAELLQGTRSDSELERLLGVLEGVRFLETSRVIWIRAGMIARELRGAGKTTALMDVVIAAVALEGDLELFTFDPDFQRIPNLRFYDPNKEPSDA